MNDAGFTPAGARRHAVGSAIGRPPQHLVALIVASFATLAAASDPTGVEDDVMARDSAGVEHAVSPDATNIVAAPRRGPATDRHPPPPPTASLPLDISPHTLRKAIAASRDPADDVRSSGSAAFGAVEPRQAKIDRAFREAEIPSCVDGTALRFEPTTIGPVALGGYLLMPLWIHAIATGRCR